MGRKIGASKRQRITKHGLMRFDVRWRERIDSRIRQLSHSFSTNAEAEAFLRTCLAKKGAVREVVSLMDEDLRKPGECTVLLQALVAQVKARSNPRSKHFIIIKNILSAVFRQFQWRLTTEIPDAAFEQIRAFYGSAKKPAAFNACQILKYFVRWAYHEKYLVNDSILVQRNIGYIKRPYYIWTDEEKEIIIQALTAQHSPFDADPTLTFSSESRRQTSEQSRRMTRFNFFPAIWIQLHWALRPMEVSLVCVKDWCARTSTLTLPHTITKNGRERDMVVDRLTATILTNLTRGKAPHDFIFTTRFGIPWKTRNQAKVFRELLRILGLRGSLYSCRHYAATTLLEHYRGEWRKVMRITGHRSMKQLETYLQEKEHRRTKPPAAYEEQYAAVWQHAHGPIRELLVADDVATGAAHRDASSPGLPATTHPGAPLNAAPISPPPVVDGTWTLHEEPGVPAPPPVTMPKRRMSGRRRRA